MARKKKDAAVVGAIGTARLWNIVYRSAVAPDQVTAETVEEALSKADKAKGRIRSVLEIS